MTRVRRGAVVVGAALALVVAGAVPALGHVTVRADDTSPGAYAKYTIRVPNESDSAATTRIEVRLPGGFDEPLVQAKPGWDLAVDAGVLTISGGEIPVGQYDEFSFVARNPGEATELRFPAVQTYSDGETAEWVGEPDSDEPAPVVEVGGEAAAGGDHGGGPGVEAVAGGGGVLAVVALLAALLGVALGAGALWSRRRG